MIRHVVVARLKPGAPREDVEKALTAMAALQVEGCLDIRVGMDAGLREGNWSPAITADFVDVDSYRRYDADEEHSRIRREVLAPIVDDAVRIQFEA